MDASIEQIVSWSSRLAGAEPVSIGWNCNTAHYLSAIGARRSAYPFDWVFSSPEIVGDAIARRFDDFIDPEQILPVDGSAAAGHRRYHARMFNHGNPAASPEIGAAYHRRMARFLARFDDESPLCLVATVLPEADKRPGWRKGFIFDFALPDAERLDESYRHVQALADRRAGPTFLVLLRQRTGQPVRSLVIAEATERTLVIDLGTVGLNDGIRFVDEGDDAFSRLLYTALFGSHARPEGR